MAKQRSVDRIKRLLDGRCPIHGDGMSQVGVSSDSSVAIVKCNRKICDIEGWTFRCNGPVMLLPDWAHVIDEDI